MSTLKALRQTVIEVSGNGVSSLPNMAATNFLAVLSLTVTAVLIYSKVQINDIPQNISLPGSCILSFLPKTSRCLVGSECLPSLHQSAILDLLKSRPKIHALKLFTGIILLLAGDISSNPRPSSSSCGICTMSVLESHKGVQCDSCDLWFHTSCCQISDSSYCRLANSTCIWICPNCGLHNLASFSVFGGSDSTLNTSNSFQPLLYEYDSIANNVHINHPLASSTPTKASTPPSHRTSLRCLEINCDSI